MKSRVLLLLGLVFLVAYSCSEDDLVQLDPNRVTPESFFETEGQLESAVLSAYASIRSGQAVGRFYYFLHDLRGDAHMPTSACFEDAALMARGGAVTSNGMIGGYWQQLYRIIHRANTALDGIAANETVDEGVKNQLAAEARFLRGWAYMELATLWGGVPIYTSRVTNPEGSAPRSSVEETWAQAESDFNFAADNLPTEWDASNQGRATRGAALGMLGRSHMQQNELAEAKSAFEELMGLNIYALNDEFLASFTEENAFLPENIFEVVFAQIGDYNWNGNGDGTNARSVRAQEYGPSWRNVVPNTKLANAFEENDPRRYQTVILEGEAFADGSETLAINFNSDPIMFNGEETYGNFYKYGVYYKQNPGGYRTTNTNFVLMRYADVLLHMAEIEARSGSLDAARGYINQIRQRAGVSDIEESDIPSTTQDEVIRAVQRERFVELASEQVRSRDMDRWRAAGILPAEEEHFYFTANKHELLPIPLQEIQTNPSVSSSDQNPGY